MTSEVILSAERDALRAEHGARAETAVLHYKPGSNLFKQSAPTYYAALTDAHIVYPWEPGGRGREGVPLPGFKPV